MLEENDKKEPQTIPELYALIKNEMASQKKLLMEIKKMIEKVNDFKSRKKRKRVKILNIKRKRESSENDSSKKDLGENTNEKFKKNK